VGGTDATEEHPKRYSVRLTPQADREAVEAAAWLSEQAGGGEERARDWYAGLLRMVGTLATDPGRLAVRERESRLLGRPVRALSYRHTPSGSRVAYHAFYQVEDDSPDGPRVTVIHVRHAARRLLTRSEARVIEERGEQA
jgi:hypothetical protein